MKLLKTIPIILLIVGFILFIVGGILKLQTLPIIGLCIFIIAYPIGHFTSKIKE
jgi:hypothetical protein